MANKPSEPNVSYDSSHSTSVRIVETVRHMQMYDINENEMQTISAWNTNATFAFSIASFLFSQALSIVMQTANSGIEKLDALGKGLLYYGLPISIVGAIIYSIRGYCLLHSRQSILKVVKDETKLKE